MAEVTHQTALVSDKGGTLDVVRDGEVLFSVNVPAGVVAARDYLALVPDGARLEIASGLVAMDPHHRVMVQPYGPGATDSGANPDFQPTSASRMEREMRVTLNRMKAATDRVERRERALAAIERVPRAPAVEQVEEAEEPPVEPSEPAAADE